MSESLSQLAHWGLIAAGGAIGTLLRYGLAGVVLARSRGGFPWGTLAVNLSGCFAIGLLWELFMRSTAGPDARAFVFVGLLGGFTTFSSFGLETFHLIDEGQWGFAAANVLVSVIVGLGLVFGGVFAGRGLAAWIK